MAWPKWKAERLVTWCESGPVRWGRLAWDGVKFGAAAGSRPVLAWLRAHPTASVALAVFAVIAVLLGPVLWVVGGWTLIQETTGRALVAFREIDNKEPEKTVEAYGKLVSAVGLLVAAPVGLLGVGLAFWRTWNQHRDGVLASRKLEAESYAKAAESFAKAVDHLGSDKSSVRMGAVLALEALGKATPRLLSQAIEILCAFVRENRPVSPSTTGEAGTKVSEAVRFPTDIQLIVKIVDRLKRLDVGRHIQIDLSNANLSRADLGGANLSRADLSGADLSSAYLSGADLSGTNLIGADLSNANLIGANLSGADLSAANLSAARLRDANLSRADLSGADLSGANLIGAHLIGADLNDADLSNANLIKADLSDAFLTGADLRRTDLRRTDVTGADLRGADLSDARLNDTDLSGAYLTNTDLRRARILDGEDADGRRGATGDSR